MSFHLISHITIEQQAFEIIWDDQSWDTDPEILKPILEDYAAQVQALSDASHSSDQENLGGP